MDRDTMVGIVGAVVLVAAMVAVFAYESSNAEAAGRPFAVTWGSRDGTVQGGSGQLTEGQCTDVTLDLPADVTRASLRIEWTDDVGAPDTFTASATGPAGSPGAGPVSASNSDGGAGLVSLDVTLNPVPTASRATGPDETQAREGVAADNVGHVGHGTWTIEVCLDSAPGTSAPVAGLPELQPDGANAFTYSATYQAYEPRLSPA